MGFLKLKELPPPPIGKTGWPWTESKIKTADIKFEKNQLPLISIVTPSLNQGEFIEETIRSVLLQKYPNIEYIIIDGGSKDNTIEIIQKYEKFLKYWISEIDKGQSDAINKGFNKSSGDIFNWINSDDYYEPNTLIEVSNNFLNKDINVYCGISRIFGNGKCTLSEGTTVYFKNLEKTVAFAKIDQPATFFKKEIWDKQGELNINLNYVMDKEFWIRYLLNYGTNGIVKNNKQLVNYRLHEKSKTVQMADNFNIETSNLFYTFAYYNGVNIIVKYLSEELNCKLIEIETRKKVLNIEKILHLFLYLKLMEFYAENENDKFQKIKKILDTKYLSTNEKKHYRDIVLKNKFPIFFKKIWNRLRK